VKIQLRKRHGISRIPGNRELKHNHPLLTSAQADIPGDIQQIAKGLLKVGMNKSACSDEPRRSLENMQDKGECRTFISETNRELKRSAIFTLTGEERGNLERFGGLVFLDGTFGRNLGHCLLLTNRKICSNGYLMLVMKTLALFFERYLRTRTRH
jgi:hypothetical protein